MHIIYNFFIIQAIHQRNENEYENDDEYDENDKDNNGLGILSKEEEHDVEEGGIDGGDQRGGRENDMDGFDDKDDYGDGFDGKMFNR